MDILNYTDLARRIGETPQQVSDVLCGRRLGRRTRQKLSALLDIPESELLPPAESAGWTCQNCRAKHGSSEQSRTCAACGGETCSECAEDCPACGEIVCAGCLTPAGCLLCERAASTAPQEVS